MRCAAPRQDHLLRLWRLFAGGCECNRATIELMRANGFGVEADEGRWYGMPAIVGPLAFGRATR